jgi:hypothetical protein
MITGSQRPIAVNANVTAMSRVYAFLKWSLAIFYVIGYWFYVIVAGIYSWNMSIFFLDWTEYMVWQCTIYGLLWPIFIW